MRVEAQGGLNPRRQPVKAFPHVGDAARQIDADVARNADHDSADKTPAQCRLVDRAGQAQLYPRGQLDLDCAICPPIGFGWCRHGSRPVVVGLPPEPAGKPFPALDRWAALIRQVSA